MNTKQKIGRACMIVGILLILGALALLGYNQWDANRADKASQDALGKLEETLTETMEDKTKDEEPVVQPELDPEQEMTVTTAGATSAACPSRPSGWNCPS